MTFQSAGETPERLPPDPAALSPEDQARYDRIALALVRTLNADDQAAYRALFTDAGWEASIDWWQNMFAGQRARFGAITRAYPCVRGTLRFGGLGYRSALKDGAAFVIIFEEKVGGVLSFALDADDQITATDVYIKEEFAQYAPEGVKPIFEAP